MGNTSAHGRVASMFRVMRNRSKGAQGRVVRRSSFTPSWGETPRDEQREHPWSLRGRCSFHPSWLVRVFAVAVMLIPTLAFVLTTASPVTALATDINAEGTDMCPDSALWSNQNYLSAWFNDNTPWYALGLFI